MWFMISTEVESTGEPVDLYIASMASSVPGTARILAFPDGTVIQEGQSHMPATMEIAALDRDGRDISQELSIEDYFDLFGTAEYWLYERYPDTQ